MTEVGYELSPFGPVPIGTPYLDPEKASPEQITAHAARYVVSADYGHGPIEQTQTPYAVLNPQPVSRVVTVALPTHPTPATSPRSVIKAARLRVKEIKSELKRMRALQSELGELERLLRAAKQKPTASVRPIRSVG